MDKQHRSVSRSSLSRSKTTMDAYHIALFLHILTLIVAASATAVTKLADGRRTRARTVGDALEWHRLLVSSARLFPICLVLFLATGVYMVRVSGSGAWSSGFVVSGFVGVALLLGSGTFLGIQARGLERMLEQIASRSADAPAPSLHPRALVRMLPAINTGIAIAVVFDMVTKPASTGLALAVIALGIVASAAMVVRGRSGIAADSDSVARAA